MADVLINIDVDDLEKGIHFYTHAFDLRVGRRFGTQAVELLGAGAPMYLLMKSSGTAPFAGAPAPRDYRRHWTPVHLDLVVTDIEAAVRRAESLGARRESEIAEQEWGRLVLMSDPFGHGFCLVAFTGRGYDEIASG